MSVMAAGHVVAGLPLVLESFVLLQDRRHLLLCHDAHVVAFPLGIGALAM